MEFYLLGLLALLLTSVTAQGWWRGCYFILILGFAQDILRKMAPDQPVYYSTLVVGAFLLVFLRAQLSGNHFRFDNVVGWKGKIVPPLMAFLSVILLQTFHTLASTGSLLISTLGLLSYTLPVVALLVGYCFARERGEKGIETFLLFYCILCAGVLSGIYLEYVGYDWPTLGEVGEGLKIYDLGTVLKAFSGFFRSSEIAAWHAVTGSCAMFLLMLRTKNVAVKIVYLLGIAMLILLGILTGRRKMIADLVLFASTFGFLIFFFQKQSYRLGVLILIVGVGSFLLASLLNLDRGNTEGRYALYVERAESVFRAAPERAQLLGLGATFSAAKRFGAFGLGAGTASQGARFDKDVKLGNLWEGEGGVGRIIIEIGVVGLLVVVWLVVAMLKHMWRVLKYLSLKMPSFNLLYFGLFSLLITNGIHFFVASPVYSDPFILLILGFILGFFMAAPLMVKREEMRQHLRLQARSQLFGATVTSLQNIR